MKVGLRLRAGAQSSVGLAHVVLDAERAGLRYVKIADGVRSPSVGVEHASAVWPAIGAIAVATRRIAIHLDGIPIAGCLHPAGVAHLALAASALLPGRFGIGLFSGPSRAVTGRVEPSRRVRLGAIAEAVDVVRRLTLGQTVDQMDSSVVINDLRMSGGLRAAPPISLTVTDEHEAVLAAELGCDLVVSTGTDPGPVVAAYRAAGGLGDTSAAIIVRGSDHDHSVAAARPLLLDRSASGDHPVELPEPGEVGWLTDDEVWTRLVDITDRPYLIEEIDRLAAAGVVSIELMSVARDPHQLVAQWRGHLGRSPSPSPSPPAAPQVAEVGVTDAIDDVIDVRFAPTGDRSALAPQSVSLPSDHETEVPAAAAPVVAAGPRALAPDTLRTALEQALEAMGADAGQPAAALFDRALTDDDLGVRLAGRSPS